MYVVFEENNYDLVNLSDTALLVMLLYRYFKHLFCDDILFQYSHDKFSKILFSRDHLFPPFDRIIALSHKNHNIHQRKCQIV